MATKSSKKFLRLVRDETQNVRYSARQAGKVERPDGSINVNRILLIEESGDVRSLVKTLLEIGGNEVQDVAGARQALQSVRSWHPDLIILNLRLPQLDGWDLFVSIRKRWPNIPVILTDEGPLTLPVSQHELSRWSVSYLPRPFGAGELFQSVESHLLKHRQSAAS